MRSLFTLFSMLIIFLISTTGNYVIASAGPGDWVVIGNTNEGGAPYNLFYYKLVQLNGSAHRYGTILEVSIQGDANYFDRQGSYQIRVDKFENSVDRFDGLEIRCISGSPVAATFYVFNNAIWIRSNYQWGNIFYRSVAEFGNASPLNAAPFNQTLTAPAGYVAITNSNGLKCDFDNNQYYRLPYQDVKGNVAVAGKIGIGTAPNYTLHTVAQGNTDKASAYLWGENYGVAIGTLKGDASNFAFAVINNVNTDGSHAAGGGKQLFFIRGDGNVGIGTNTPQAKLAVNGDLYAKRIKVVQTGWPDFVFQEDYRLPTLQEVEHFIKENKHLQNIPSEKEVNENGIDVGEINKKLLQKVEELTLYIIDLKKESEQQQQRIQKLEGQLK